MAGTPLKTPWFYILVSLAAADRHGLAIAREVRALSDGRVRLWPATLYGALSELVAKGLLAEVASEAVAATDDDPRRRYYGLTTLGRHVLEAEQRRLEELAQAVRIGLGQPRTAG